MPIDREYVMAAYCGMLHAGVPTDAFIAKYGLSHAEQRRAAIVAIQMIMQRYYADQSCWEGDVAARRIRTIAARYDINELELVRMAWEVLRGAVETGEEIGNDEFVGESMLDLMRHFLIDHLPVSTRFGFAFSGHYDAFQPREVVPLGSGELLNAVVKHHNVNDTPHSPEAIELLRDAGLNVDPYA